MKRMKVLAVTMLVFVMSCRSMFCDEYSRLIIGEWTFVKQELKYKVNSTEPPTNEVVRHYDHPAQFSLSRLLY